MGFVKCGGVYDRGRYAGPMGPKVGLRGRLREVNYDCVPSRGRLRDVSWAKTAVSFIVWLHTEGRKLHFCF